MPSNQPTQDVPTGARSGRPSLVPGVVLGLATAALNAAVVLVLYDRYGYPFPEGTALAVFLGALVVFGFVPGFVSGHTRLIVPALGFVALVAGVAVLEVTSSPPQWSELGGHPVAYGELYVHRWANRLYVPVALLLAGGVAEFGLRSAYGLAADRLRDLPALPFSRYVVAWVAGGFGALFGATTTLMVWRIGVNPSGVELVVFVCATLAVAVPLAALLARGLVVPLALFVLIVPRPTLFHVLVGSDSPVFLLLLGPLAAAFAVAGVAEHLVRRRFRDDGGDGGAGVPGGPGS